MKKILAIIGSTRSHSSSLQLAQIIASKTSDIFQWNIFTGIAQLPHFNQDLDNENVPDTVKTFRQLIQDADGILISTPEYVFSLPGSLKNALEWCVSTTVFSAKPTALITAAASGEKAHESLQLVMKTIETVFTPATTLLIKGARGKLDEHGAIKDIETAAQLNSLIAAFTELVQNTGQG